MSPPHNWAFLPEATESRASTDGEDELGAGAPAPFPSRKRKTRKGEPPAKRPKLPAPPFSGQLSKAIGRGNDSNVRRPFPKPSANSVREHGRSAVTTSTQSKKSKPLPFLNLDSDDFDSEIVSPSKPSSTSHPKRGPRPSGSSASQPARPSSHDTSFMPSESGNVLDTSDMLPDNHKPSASSSLSRNGPIAKRQEHSIATRDKQPNPSGSQLSPSAPLSHPASVSSALVAPFRAIPKGFRSANHVVASTATTSILPSLPKLGARSSGTSAYIKGLMTPAGQVSQSRLTGGTGMQKGDRTDPIDILDDEDEMPPSFTTNAKAFAVASPHQPAPHYAPVNSSMKANEPAVVYVISDDEETVPIPIPIPMTVDKALKDHTAQLPAHNVEALHTRTHVPAELVSALSIDSSPVSGHRSPLVGSPSPAADIPLSPPAFTNRRQPSTNETHISSDDVIEINPPQDDAGEDMDDTSSNVSSELSVIPPCSSRSTALALDNRQLGPLHAFRPEQSSTSFSSSDSPAPDVARPSQTSPPSGSQRSESLPMAGHSVLTVHPHPSPTCHRVSFLDETEKELRSPSRDLDQLNDLVPDTAAMVISSSGNLESVTPEIGDSVTCPRELSPSLHAPTLAITTERARISRSKSFSHSDVVHNETTSSDYPENSKELQQGKLLEGFVGKHASVRDRESIRRISTFVRSTWASWDEEDSRFEAGSRAQALGSSTTASLRPKHMRSLSASSLPQTVPTTIQDGTSSFATVAMLPKMSRVHNERMLDNLVPGLSTPALRNTIAPNRLSLQETRKQLSHSGSPIPYQEPSTPSSMHSDVYSKEPLSPTMGHARPDLNIAHTSLLLPSSSPSPVSPPLLEAHGTLSSSAVVETMAGWSAQPVDNRSPSHRPPADKSANNTAAPEELPIVEKSQSAGGYHDADELRTEIEEEEYLRYPDEEEEENEAEYRQHEDEMEVDALVATSSLSPLPSSPGHEAAASVKSTPSANDQSLPTTPIVASSTFVDLAPLAPVAADIEELTNIVSVLSFEDQKELLRPGPYKRVIDIPKEIHPHLSKMTRRQLQMCRAYNIFQGMMVEADEGVAAPSIGIYNQVDDEACPPFEFIYSNEMYYETDVPPPDYDGVKGCGCIGPCDPESETCSCLRRQEVWTGENGENMFEGFSYDEHGRHKDSTMPIFECNWRCGCDDDCTNRVVQHGRKCQVNIVKTKQKGWGVFAGAKTIPMGTFIGVYAGEIMTNDLAEIKGEEYNRINRTYLFDIDFWHMADPKAQNPVAVHVIPPVVKEPSEWEVLYAVDAFRIGNFTRFLNHSCDPNAYINAVYVDDADFNKPLFCIFAYRDIRPYEEICFSYFGLNQDLDSAAGPGKTPARSGLRTSKCYCGAAKCRGQMFI